MELLTFHRILIGSAIAVFLIYAGQQLWLSTTDAGGSAFSRSMLSFLGVGILVAYWRWMAKRRRSP